MKEVFTNTFQNGLSSDYNIVYQPDGTYRYMKNCQLISQDGNNYVIKDCIGNTVTFTINEPYNAVYTTMGTLPTPIGFISFPDKLIVLSTNNAGEPGGYGEIGMLKYLPYGEGIKGQAISTEINAGYVPLYHHISLNFSQLHRTKGFSFIENELIERIYWTDFYNEPRVFNVSNPIFTTYAASGFLTVGQEYMVLQGAVQHPVGGGNPIYGPGLTAGNIFTASSTGFTDLTSPNRPPMIVEYYPYKLLDFTPSRSMGNIKLLEYGSGNLYCGAKVYYYRLSSTEGVVTSWSYGSSPISVGTLNSTSALTSPTVSYHDFVGGGTSNVLLNSTLSVLLTVDGIDDDFDYIEVACAEFDQSELAPRQITIIAKEAITGTSMTITHNGSINLGELTIGDITLFPASIIKCKTLATNKNFLLAGNTVEREEFAWDNARLLTIGQVERPLNVHYDAASCSLSGMIPDGTSPLSGGYSAAGPTAAGTITPFSQWKVTSGTVTYNGTNYTTGEVFTGVPGVLNSDIATLAAASSFVPVVSINKYTTFSGDARPNSIELKKTNDTINDCFRDYKSAAVSSLVRGNWSGETYRLGLLVYDLKGNPFYVIWLGDYTMETLLNKTGNLLRRDQIGTTGNYMYSVNPSGFVLDGLTFSPEQAAQMSGFSIVRAERDPRIITQGILTQNVNAGGTPNVSKAGSWVPISFDAHGVTADQYSFICPDALVGAPLKSSIGVVGDSLEEATWLDPYDYGGGSVVRGSDYPTPMAGPSQVYTKFLSCVDDSVLRSCTITDYKDVVEDGNIIIGPTGETFANQMIVGGAGGVVKGTCVSGGADYNLNAGEATGGARVYIKTDDDFLHYGPSAFPYTSNNIAATALPQKILMNYVKTGTGTPYGGTGESSLANTIYISTGHFQPINSTVLGEVFDGVNYVFNGVEVFGGDCYTCLVDYGYGLYNSGLGSPEYSYAWTFPCECNANYNLRRGRKTSNVGMFYTGAADSTNIAFLSTLNDIRLEDFSYNPSYTSEGQSVVYPALPVNFINSTEFQARIRRTNQKIIGENIDSFRQFPLLNLLDISANYGRINDINVKDDKVVVWQDNAVNTVPVQERQVVSGGSGDDTVIGTGGVVDRWDVISSFFGTQHQWSICETEYGFAWFDMRRKAFVILDFGGGLQEISQIYGEKGRFDEAFLEIEGTQAADPTILLNSTTFADTSDRPLTGVGIISVYDPKFKMTYMTFKFMGQNNLDVKTKDFTIGYLHTNTKKCFVGFFDSFPSIVHNHNGYVMMVNNPKNTTQYLLKSGGLANESFVVGETLWGDALRQREYVCIANVTLDNAAKFPEGASGATYWQLINQKNQVWVLNQPTSLNETTAPGYNYNSFFGRVVNNQVDIVINPQIQDDETIEVQNISQNGPNNVNYTDVYVSADNQSGSDTTIASTNRNYRFIRDRIVSNIPHSTASGYEGRINNRYLLISFVKKNWTGVAPTVVSTSVKILRSLTSYFIKKK